MVGVLSMAAGWFYTGGPRPYGYAGLGELFVFVFFGLVATVGTAYVHLGRITGLAVLAAVPVGLLAVAMLLVNNLRDIENDIRHGKHTFATFIGRPAALAELLGTDTLAFAAVVVGAATRVLPGLALAVFLTVPRAGSGDH